MSDARLRMSQWFWQQGGQALCCYRLKMAPGFAASAVAAAVQALYTSWTQSMMTEFSSFGMSQEQWQRLHALCRAGHFDEAGVNWCWVELPHVLFDAQRGLQFIDQAIALMTPPLSEQIPARSSRQKPTCADAVMAWQQVASVSSNTAASAQGRTFTQQLLQDLVGFTPEGLRFVMSFREREFIAAPASRVGNSFFVADWTPEQAMRLARLPSAQWRRYRAQVEAAFFALSEEAYGALPQARDERPLVTSVGRFPTSHLPLAHFAEAVEQVIMYPGQVPLSSRVLTAYAYKGISQVVLSGAWPSTMRAGLIPAWHSQRWQVIYVA